MRYNYIDPRIAQFWEDEEEVQRKNPSYFAMRFMRLCVGVIFCPSGYFIIPYFWGLGNLSLRIALRNSADDGCGP